MTGIPHVKLTPSGVYKYRRGVPKALREALERRELKETLGKDRAAAKRRAAELDAIIDGKKSEQKFGDISRNADFHPSEELIVSNKTVVEKFEGASSADKVYCEITLDEAESMVADWLRKEIRRCEEYIAIGGECEVIDRERYGPFVPSDPSDLLRELLTGLAEPDQVEATCEDARNSAWYEVNKPEAPLTIQDQLRNVEQTDEILEFEAYNVALDYGKRIEVGSRSWLFLRNAMLRAKIMLDKEIARRLEGDWTLPLSGE